MNLIKRLMPLIAAIVMAFSSSAAVKYVVVNDDQDQSSVFALEDEPTVTFSSTELIINVGDKTVSYPLTDRVTFTFSEDVTAIEQILALPSNLSFTWEGQRIDIAGLNPMSRVALYQADGKMLEAVTSDEQGRISLDVESYKGVIIISTEAKAFKIAK